MICIEITYKCIDGGVSDSKRIESCISASESRNGVHIAQYIDASMDGMEKGSVFNTRYDK